MTIEHVLLVLMQRLFATLQNVRDFNVSVKYINIRSIVIWNCSALFCIDVSLHQWAGNRKLGKAG